MYIYIYIYIYIYRERERDGKGNTCIYIHTHTYIYCHPQTDCFIVSQLFSVARHVGCLKLESKPTQLYVRLSIRPLGQRAYHIGKIIIRYYVATAAAAAFVCLHFIPYRIPECSIRSKSFALCERQPKIPLPECSTPMEECIYCHPQIDCFIVSQLFSVARNIGHLKLGLKPALFIIKGFQTIVFIFIVISTFSIHILYQVRIDWILVV